MTDTATISDATIAEVGKLAPEAKAAAREQLAKHYSPAEIERAFGATVKPSDKPEAAPAHVVVRPDDGIDPLKIQGGLVALYKHGTPDMRAKVLAQAKSRAARRSRPRSCLPRNGLPLPTLIRPSRTRTARLRTPAHIVSNTILRAWQTCPPINWPSWMLATGRHC